VLSGAVLVAAGCGGSSDEGSATTETTETTETSTTDTSGSSGSKSQLLSATVGPGFDIAMERSTVPAGTYTLTVDDESDQHNFHLTGPGGVDVSTEVGTSGTKTFTVTLEKGTYTFVCDPHSSSMHGTLTVS
jgi:plastocyanin